MTISLTFEIGNSLAKNFSELEEEVCGLTRSIGQEIIRIVLETLDSEILAERDTQRYRCKGFRKTCAKTMLGNVEYKRRVYEDTAAAEGVHCVYLLDNELNMNKVGLASANVCRLAASSICESSYRKTAELITNSTGLSISHQGIWRIIQELGEKQERLVERHTELAGENKGVGEIATKILYEEDDGVWLNLQRKSRQENGPSKEMKVGIAYDGVRCEKTGSGERRILDNKVAYASFESAGEFRKSKEGLVASRYDVDEIELRVHNGDGANWIRRPNTENSIDVLDEFHRDKKITECVRDPEFAALLRSLLDSKKIDMLLNCIEAQINSLTDAAEIEKLRELQHYYTENKDSLLDYRDRGIPIPETREPGVIHHARLGSMESNIFTLIGNRMKGGRANWSIDGANHLALLLCQKCTIGFENLFAKLPPIPEKEPEWVDPLPLMGAGSVPAREGHGFEYPDKLSISETDGWLNSFLKALASKPNNF